MASIFTKIIHGEIPSYTIAEDENYFAFLDIHPMSKGHTLVVPKLEVDILFDLPKDIYMGLMAFSRKVAKAIERAIPCNRVGVLVFGLEVPHAHVHLIPINQGSDMSIAKPKLVLSTEEFKDIATSIRDSYEALG